MKRFKKFSTMIIFSVITSLFVATIAMAAEKENVSITLEPIAISELPANVKPENLLHFNSAEDAIKYFEESVIIIDETSEQPMLRSTNGLATVASKSVKGVMVKLMANYGTSGSSNTGRITYVSPFMQTYGVMDGAEFVQKNIGYSILANQKDVYCYGNGELKFYVYVNTAINVLTYPINLSGTFWAVR